jgi:uncharacterized protein YaiI (UPF0178 family)
LVRVLVDADACPVKDEVYVVASRYGLPVLLVANTRLDVPSGLEAEMIVVEGALDAADDRIAERTRAGDVVVTADIPLASRCLAAGGRVLGPDGRPFTESSIGGALATRELKAHLRETGIATRGPRPLQPRDRSRFLSKLDELVQKSLREA